MRTCHTVPAALSLRSLGRSALTQVGCGAAIVALCAGPAFGLDAGGMSPADVVSVQVYLTDGALFQRMNAVYTTYFKDPRPTRTTVVVAKLVGPGHIEITATAKK